MTDKRKEKSKLDLLNDILIEDLFVSSDEEIMADAALRHKDPVAAALKIRNGMQDAVILHRKSRLKKAKENCSNNKKERSNVVLQISSFEQKKQIIKKLSPNDNLAKKITMAARKEEEFTENDLDIFLQKAFKLGMIDEEGNIL